MDLHRVRVQPVRPIKVSAVRPTELLGWRMLHRSPGSASFGPIYYFLVFFEIRAGMELISELGC
jgi:hypothetical protein